MKVHRMFLSEDMNLFINHAIQASLPTREFISNQNFTLTKAKNAWEKSYMEIVNIIKSHPL